MQVERLDPLLMPGIVLSALHPDLFKTTRPTLTHPRYMQTQKQFNLFLKYKINDLLLVCRSKFVIVFFYFVNIFQPTVVGDPSVYYSCCDCPVLTRNAIFGERARLRLFFTFAKIFSCQCSPIYHSCRQSMSCRHL
jgi:hypothetical protein